MFCQSQLAVGFVLSTHLGGDILGVKVQVVLSLPAHLQAASERQGFNAEDFPSVSGGPGSGGVMSGGRWAAAGRAAGGRITPEDFPALPGAYTSSSVQLTCVMSFSLQFNQGTLSCRAAS